MSAEPLPAQRPPLSTQLIRFVITGGLSAIVDFGLLSLGTGLGLHYALAKALSFIAGTTTAYLINRRWTFQSDGSSKTLAAVVALYALTFGLQWGIFTLLYPRLVELGWGQGPGSWAQAAAFVVAQGVATTVNFVVQRSVIFRHPASSGEGDAGR